MQFSPEIERVRSISDFIKAHVRRCWVESFGLPIVPGWQHGPESYLHLIEFDVPGADDDELRAGFEAAYHELGPRNDIHVGLCYVSQASGSARTVLRALVLVHPTVTQHLPGAAAKTASGTSSRLSISRCDFDHGDPDAAYRWFAEGISREAQNPAWPRFDGIPVSPTDWTSPVASQIEALS